MIPNLDNILEVYMYVYTRNTIHLDILDILIEIGEDRDPQREREGNRK